MQGKKEKRSRAKRPAEKEEQQRDLCGRLADTLREWFHTPGVVPNKTDNPDCWRHHAVQFHNLLADHSISLGDEPLEDERDPADPIPVVDPTTFRLCAAAIEAGLKKDHGPTHPQVGKFTPKFLQSVARHLMQAATALEGRTGP